MNREAVALGTPVWNDFEGSLGAVDEHAHRRRAPRRLQDREELDLGKRERPAGAERGAPRPRCWCSCSPRRCAELSCAVPRRLHGQWRTARCALVVQQYEDL